MSGEAKNSSQYKAINQFLRNSKSVDRNAFAKAEENYKQAKEKKGNKQFINEAQLKWDRAYANLRSYGNKKLGEEDPYRQAYRQSFREYQAAINPDQTITAAEKAYIAARHDHENQVAACNIRDGFIKTLEKLGVLAKDGSILPQNKWGNSQFQGQERQAMLSQLEEFAQKINDKSQNGFKADNLYILAAKFNDEINNNRLGLGSDARVFLKTVAGGMVAGAVPVVLACLLASPSTIGAGAAAAFCLGVASLILITSSLAYRSAQSDRYEYGSQISEAATQRGWFAVKNNAPAIAAAPAANHSSLEPRLRLLDGAQQRRLSLNFSPI
ncbi:MAG: hypothetical protein K0Q74_104 [Gammaproteobacteria bacterium]|jgi:hypothetical protein|nr:hypothetical protein [Gammaproteobacteria bacterium]